MLQFQKAKESDFTRIQAFYWDVLGACRSAERLYRKCGFQFVEAKNMYYEDTGWTEYKLFELNL